MENVELLKRQRDYLVRFPLIPARIATIDYDFARDTVTYVPDKEAIDLFGKGNLCFVVGYGTVPAHYYVYPAALA